MASEVEDINNFYFHHSMRKKTPRDKEFQTSFFPYEEYVYIFKLFTKQSKWTISKNDISISPFQ